MTNLRAHIADRLRSFGKIAVWGAGSGGLQALNEWLPAGRVACIVDARRDLGPVNGLPVVSPDDLATLQFDCIVICVDAYLEVSEELARRNFAGSIFYVFELFPNAAELSEFEKLRLDIRVQKDRPWHEFVLFRPQILVNVTYRLARAALTIPFIGWFARLLHTMVSVPFGISIPPTVEAGPGLAFAHFGTMVIHPQARIGSFVRLYHLVTIGSNDGGRVPLLHDFVTVYAGAMVVGDSTIGSHARVGAQAFVSDMSVPAGATVVGAPAKIVHIHEAAARQSEMKN